MKPIVLLVGAVALLGSCTSLRLHPRVRTVVDPFTGVYTRYMSVTDSEYSNEDGSPPANKLLYLAKSPQLGYGDSRYLSLSSSQGDTVLNFVRLLPESHFDVPDSARLLILLKGEGQVVMSLPLVKSYHTIGGPLLAKAYVDQASLVALSQREVDGIRIDRVQTNEADETPVTWYWTGEYPRLFREGVQLFMAPSAPAKRTAPAKGKQKKKVDF